MDTNQNNRADNYLINAFYKGMNSDTSYDMIGADQYVFGLNIRITKNTTIGGEINANTKENVVARIGEGKDVTIDIKADKILATAAIENVGAIVVQDGDTWKVYRADYDGSTISTNCMFISNEQPIKDKFSVVINKELKDLTKLYIADGVHPLMCLNLDNKDGDGYRCINGEDNIISNRFYPTKPVCVYKKISGLLKTQQVQYTYRFYTKYGISSKLAPLTSKLQIIDSNRKKEIGNAEDTVTSIGLQLKVDTTNAKQFDHIQVFRVSYIKYHENAEINLIYDAKIHGDEFVLNDTGIQSLAQYTMEEFAALSGMTIIPNVIELNQGYLFAGNVQDDTILRIENYDASAHSYDVDGNATLYTGPEDDEGRLFNVYDDLPNAEYYYDRQADINYNGEITLNCGKHGYLGGHGKNVSWRFITCKIPISNVTEDVDQSLYYITSEYRLEKINDDACDIKTFFANEKNVTADFDLDYNDIFVSSYIRSLRRDEVYRYGIVFYDKHGSRSNTLWIADIKTPTSEQLPITYKLDTLYALPIGIKFDVNIPEGFESYQIVRCEKSPQYTKNLMNVALSRPMRQGKYNQDTYRTPWYPNLYLSTQFFYTGYGKNANDGLIWNEGFDVYDLWTQYFDKGGTNVENDRLYQAFSSLINIRREDELSRLSVSDIRLKPLYYALTTLTDKELCLKIQAGTYDRTLIETDGIKYKLSDQNSYVNLENALTSSLTSNTGFIHNIENIIYLSVKYLQPFEKSTKISHSVNIDLYDNIFDVKCNDSSTLLKDSVTIKHIADVKNPKWEEGFSDIQLNGSTVVSAIKQYKSFNTNIGTENYVNWVANGLYDSPATNNDKSQHPGVPEGANFKVFINSNEKLEEDGTRSRGAYGWIGPGPVCFLLNVDPGVAEDSILKHHIIKGLQSENTWIGANMGTIIANIQHTAVQFAGSTLAEMQYDTYYGFGNYSNSDQCYVFDGDVYITPNEFVNMFKTYNFNDLESTIPSGQVVYNIPLESTINTFFDYGMNYRNTANSNLQLVPGLITGVGSQDRPLHQYNMVYSDNNVSNDVFAAQSIEEDVNTYTQRIHYSQLKLNGENIDNWHIFKPADFIDTDSRYGDLTCLLTADDILYYWLTNAFGKLSVNERSLVQDTNSNMIQLGQGAVLQRTDYISTQYGMMSGDYSATSVEGSVYWIDRQNKTVVGNISGETAYHRTKMLDMCEVLNIKNICNNRFDDSRIPNIEYDVESNELLCNCLKHDLQNLQIVFNLKLGIATSVYTRLYDSCIEYNNIIVSLAIDNNKSILAKRQNYLEEEGEYLRSMLSFVVNSSPQQTKVFDNLKVVTVKAVSNDEYTNDTEYSFTTDLYYTNNDISGVTDREGNICYTIPRYGSEDYGNRLRGKWMKVDITIEPDIDCAISHIITKFRQSYS